MSVGGQLWADTGDVDPVLARVVHLLHHHWDDGDDPSCARMLAELDLVIAGTIGDDALSRQRALFVINRVLRQDLPRLLRAVPQSRSMACEAASCLERLAPVENSSSARGVVGLTFVFERQLVGVARRMMVAVWEAARHTETALVACRNYQLGTAAVAACGVFVECRRAAELGPDWVPAGDLARDLAVSLVRGAAAVSCEGAAAVNCEDAAAAAVD